MIGTTGQYDDSERANHPRSEPIGSGAGFSIPEGWISVDNRLPTTTDGPVYRMMNKHGKTRHGCRPAELPICRGAIAWQPATDMDAEEHELVRQLRSAAGLDYAEASPSDAASQTAIQSTAPTQDRTGARPLAGPSRGAR